MLVDEIIDLLSNENCSLTEALLKTQVLLHRLGKKELAEWVKYELNGYPDGANIPDYRKLPASVMGNACNMAYRITAHPLPVGHLNENTRENLQTIILAKPLSVIEDMASKEEGSVSISIPLEYNPVFNEVLGNGFMVEAAWRETPIHDVKGIMTQIRSRLLDFILELKDTAGDTKDEDKAKEKLKAADTTSMFNNAIFGPNTTIVVGNNNQQSVMNIQKGDIQSLVNGLSDLGIPPEEIENLKKAILTDEKELGSASFEGETGKWYANLLRRAGKGVLGVGVDIVSTTVAKALAIYLGCQ